MRFAPPHDLPMDGRADIQQYVLSPAQVAAVLGVSRQLVAYWGREGRPSTAGRVWPGGIRKGKHNWFSVANVDEFAEACDLVVDWTRLPLELQRTLGVGWFTIGAPVATLEQLDERISEAEAARQLGLSPVGLRKRRERGALDEVLAQTLLPSPSGHGGVTYSQRAVWALAEVV